MRQEPDIEALAEHLSWQDVYDWVMGDGWFGYPSGEAQEREAMLNGLPQARETAREYARILGVLPDEGEGNET